MSDCDWLRNISATRDVFIDTNCFLFAVLWPNLASGRAVHLVRRAGGCLIFTPPVVRETHRELGKRYPNQRVQVKHLVRAMGRWGRVDIGTTAELESFAAINSSDREMVAIAAQNESPLLTADLPLVMETRGIGLDVYQPWDIVRSHADYTGLQSLDSVSQVVPWREQGGYFFGRVRPTMPTRVRPMTVFDKPGVASVWLDAVANAWVFEFAGSPRVTVDAKIELAAEVCINAQYRVVDQRVELVLRVMDSFKRVRRKSVTVPAPTLPKRPLPLRLAASADGSKAFNGSYRDLVFSPGWISEKAFNQFAMDGHLAPIPEVGLWPPALPTHVKQFLGEESAEF